MNLTEAERILGVKAGASAEAVRAAFYARAKAVHPDTTQAPFFSSLAVMEAKQARDLLLERAGVTPTSAKPCPVCRGTGIQVIGLRRVPCVRGCDST